MDSEEAAAKSPAFFLLASPFRPKDVESCGILVSRP